MVHQLRTSRKLLDGPQMEVEITNLEKGKSDQGGNKNTKLEDSLLTTGGIKKGPPKLILLGGWGKPRGEQKTNMTASRP